MSTSRLMLGPRTRRWAHDRCDAFHHNPRFRGGDDGLCCVPMPIKFRWSGSNVHPHYMTGGKGLVGGPTPDPRPLHNHPNHVPGQGETWGSAAARKTWRGINMLYADDLHFNNPFYGGGYSWGTAPGTFVLMYEPAWDPLATVWAKYPAWGLRPGDVIEAVHIQEIIDAVDYLIDYGVWTSIGLCTRKRTPGQFMGKDCGYHYAADYQDCYGTDHVEYRKGCDKCCANAEACWPYDHVLGYWPLTRENLEDANADAAPIAEQAPTPPAVLMNGRATRALAAMRKLRVDDHKDGNRRLFAAASIAVRFGLDTNSALVTIREYLNSAPTPRKYSDADILKRLHDAERTCVRGEALNNVQARGAAALSTAKPSALPPEPFQPFPVDALPDRMRVFVESVAAVTGADPSYAALAALVLVAGYIGNRVAVLVKSGWVEPAVLWGVLVGRSGTTKSPVLKLVTRALVNVFKAERRAFADAMKEYAREVERHNVRLAERKKSQRNGPPTDPFDEPERPTECPLLVSDITVEKLAELLEQNPLGLLLVRDELAAWVGVFDRYAAGGKGSDQPAWLSMYDAAPVTVDRKSGKGTYFVERAAVSVLGSIQPGTLARSFGVAEREAGLRARARGVPAGPAGAVDGSGAAR